MRSFALNFLNSTKGSSLHCVWVHVQDDRGDRLVSIWIDPAAAEIGSQRQETACGIDPAASPIAGNQGDDTGQLDAENHLNCVLPFCA
jgi:hypothetical protein